MASYSSRGRLVNQSRAYFKVLFDAIINIDTGKITWNFFEEFNTYTEAHEYIKENKLTQFRLIKTYWEDITDLVDNKK